MMKRMLAKLPRALRSHAAWLGMAAALCVAVALPRALADDAGAEGTAALDDTGLFRPGDVAATGFSGVKLQLDGLPPGIDPLSKTVIDPEGTTLSVFDASQIGGLPDGQQLDPPLRRDFKAKDIGQVFGLAFDDLAADERGVPGLYAAASSAFGLYIVGPDKDGDGQPDRLTRGAAGAAFMPGLFGPAPGGGAGAIWKIDGATGAVSLYAELTGAGQPNSGPGIGGLAFDPVSRSLYASDLDTGLVHQLSGAATGADLATFDHGVQGRPLGGREAVADDGARLDITSADFDTTDPATWKITQAARRVDALAVHGRRLYYAVAEGPEIWSVGLADDGGFQQDARIELGVTITQPGTVTAITFDRAGNMILAIRNAPQNKGDYGALASAGPADVLRFAPESPDDPQTPFVWEQDPLTYPVGQASGRESSGGVALQYAYRPDGSIDEASCDGTVIASGDALGPQQAAHGLQFGAAGQFQAADGPAIAAAFVALDPAQDNKAARGHAGGVAVLTDCGGGADFPALAGDEASPSGFPEVAGSGHLLPPLEDIGKAIFPEVEDVDGTGGGVSIAKSGAVPSCSPKGGCAFNIDVTNDGPEVPGPITVKELIEAPQAQLTGQPNAPWQCSNAAPFTCTHPGPIPADGKLDTLRVVFAPNLPADAKVVNNCAELSDAAPDNAPKKAAQAPLPPPPAPTSSNNGGLLVEKKGTTAICSPTKGDCEFEIRITNQTGAEIKDQPLTISDTLSVGTQSQAKNELNPSSLPAGFKCQPQGREFTCTNDALTLAPNASISLKASGKIDTSEGGPASFVTNTVNVTLGPLTGQAKASIAFDEPVNQLPEPKPADQQDAGKGDAAKPAKACASIPLDSDAPVQTGPVVLSKKGPAVCPRQGPCTFDITLTNTTDQAVPGPIDFSDTMNIPGAKLADQQLPAPFTCGKDGPPFKCSFGDKNTGLGPREARTVSLKFDLDLPAGTTELTNCAVMTDGKAPEKPGAPADPQAPQKKASLLPFGLRPLFTRANFVPQSRARGNGLLHFVADPGGNIGGVGPPVQQCTTWGAKNGGFVLRQSNDLVIHFSDMTVNAFGGASGKASYFPTTSADGLNAAISGTFEGVIKGGVFDLRVKWKNGDTGHYVGNIGQDGKVTGTNASRDGVTVTFRNEGDWWTCKNSTFCESYAQKAVVSAALFSSEGCPPTGPAGRWTTDKQAHIDFCMAHSGAGDPATQDEDKARENDQATCKAIKTAGQTCSKFADDYFDVNEEMKTLKCAATEEPNKLAFLGSACMLNPPKAAELLTAKKAALDSCKAQLAANGGAPANDGGAGANDGGAAANDGGAPADGGGAAGQDAQANLAPEQCTVVKIEDEQPDQPGGGGKVGKPVLAANGLEITKSIVSDAACTADNCQFQITVKNTTNAEIAGPIRVDDQLTGGTADEPKSFKTALTSGPQAPWTCAPPAVSPTLIECIHPGPLAAGESVALAIGMRLIDPADSKVMRNCASVDGRTASCVTQPLDAAPKPPAGPVLKLTKKVDPCVLNAAKARFECNFLLTVANKGDATFAGPLTITDETPLADGLNVTFTTIPPWDCPTVGDPANGLRDCTNRNVSIEPEGSVALPLLVTIPTAREDVCLVENFAQIKDPAPAKDAKGLDTLPASATARVPNKNCTVTDLAILKTATPECAKNAAGNFVCSYNIAVSNAGQAPFKDKIVIVDNFGPAISFSQSPKDVFACATGDHLPEQPVTVVCKSNDVVSLAPGGPPQEFKLDFEVGPTSATADKCKVNNLASLLSPSHGTPGNADLADDFSVAIAKIPMVPGPNGEVPCDPPALKLTKIANPQLCSKVAGGFLCTYDIAVTSTGPDPYHGPITVADTLPVGASLGTVSGAGWNCPGPVTAGAAKCSHPFVDLAVGDSLTLTASAFVPETGVKPGACDITNTVALSLSTGPLSGQNYNASATAKIDSPLCLAEQPSAPSEPRVTIAKSALSPSCSEGAPCEFVVTLTNNGDRLIRGGVAFYDTMLTGSQQLSQVRLDGAPPAPWTCVSSAAPGMQCSYPGPLAAKTGVSMRFSMIPLPGSLGAATELTNCANYVSDQTVRACVDVPVKPATVAPTTQCTSGMVLTDGNCACPEGSQWNGIDCGTGGFNTSKPITDEPSPPAVTITKSALSASCSEGAPCEFVVTLTNNGDRLLRSGVAFYDTMLTGSQQLSQVKLDGAPPAPWTCVSSAAPGMQCSYPGPLAAKTGVSMRFSMIPLPGALGSATELTNCANYVGDQNVRACVDVPVKPATTAPTVQCTGGMVLTNGSCACPAGSQWNGMDCGTGGFNLSKPITDAPPACRFGMVLTARGVCACPAGSRWNGTSCAGQTGNGGASEAKTGGQAAKPIVKCKQSEILDIRTAKCVACPRGKHVEGNACVADKARPSKEVCLKGFQFERGKCRRVPRPETPTDLRKKPAPKTCPDDRPIGNYPNCCPTGTVFSGGKCLRVAVKQRFCEGAKPNGIYPNCCEIGSSWSNGACRQDRRVKPTQPQPVPQPTRHDCPAGYRELDRPNKYGAYCEIIPVTPPAPQPAPQACSAGKVGTPPNCKCPGGYEDDGDGGCMRKVQ